MAWLRRILTSGRTRWVAALLALLTAGGFLLLRGGPPGASDELEQLERAQQAGSRAAEQREQITRNLERIASRLREGAGLGEASERIHDLTVRQQQSLADLAELLRGQLGSIERTGRSLERSRESARKVERVGEIESRRAKETLRSLRTLERATRRAVARSADLARQAIYGARLAEDSAEAFEP